jgi:transketolase
MCLGLKRKGSGSRVFTLFSDGELDEGSKWEAMMSAAHHKLDNLIAIVDVNNQQADGPSKQMMGFEPLAEKIRAFGWFCTTYRRQRPRCCRCRLRHRNEA